MQKQIDRSAIPNEFVVGRLGCFAYVFFPGRTVARISVDYQRKNGHLGQIMIHPHYSRAMALVTLCLKRVIRIIHLKRAHLR